MNVTTYGVDIAKHVFQVHWIEPQTGEIRRRKLSRAKFTDFFAQRQPGRIAMEACSGSHHWGRTLAALGHQVELLPARLVHSFVVGNKDDAADARAIYVAAHQSHIRRVLVKSVEQQALQAAHRVRSQWMSTRKALINNLRGLLNEFGVTLPKGKEAGLKALASQRSHVDAQIPPLMARLADLQLAALRQINEVIGAIEHELQAVQKTSPVARQLREVPGIGLLSATALTATLGDATGWRNARQFACCMGLTPAHAGTGGKVRVGSISKKGDPYIRTLLVSGANSLLNCAKKDPWLEALLQRRPRNVVVVALANKLARTAWALVANARRYDPAWRSVPPQRPQPRTDHDRQGLVMVNA
jgi:transposase